MTDYSALAEDLNNGAGEDNSSTSSNDGDYSDAPILNVCPTVAVEYDEILDIGIMGGIKEEQNVRKSNERGNDIVITLKNPTVGEGELYKAKPEQGGADYKLVDPDHERVKKDVVENEDGEFEVEGVQVYGWDFKSVEVDDFDEDYVRLMIGSAAGQRLAQIFDCRGGVSAYYNGDEKTTGLIEYPPEYNSDDYNPRENDTDRYPRVARSPTLRDDLSGSEGVLFFYMGDGGMHKVDVFDGEPTVENKASIIDDGGEPEWNPYIVWDEPGDNEESSDQGNGENQAEDSTQNTSTSNSGDEPDFSALSDGESDSDNEENTQVTGYEDLSAEQQAFVDRLAESDNIDVEEADVSHLYTQFAEDNGMDPIDAGIIEDIVVEAAA